MVIDAAIDVATPASNIAEARPHIDAARLVAADLTNVTIMIFASRAPRAPPVRSAGDHRVAAPLTINLAEPDAFGKRKPHDCRCVSL
jgi:hypothetical protein